MSFDVSFEVIDFDKLYRLADKVEKKAIKAGEDGMIILAQKIVQEIKDHYVPVFTGQAGHSGKGFSPRMMGKLSLKSEEGGTLRESVGYEIVTQPNGEIVVTIFAGRPGSGAEEYAWIQHENLMYHHYVGQAKYIEVPVSIMAPEGMTREVSSALQAELSIL